MGTPFAVDESGWCSRSNARPSGLSKGVPGRMYSLEIERRSPVHGPIVLRVLEMRHKEQVLYAEPPSPGRE